MDEAPRRSHSAQTNGAQTSAGEGLLPCVYAELRKLATRKLQRLPPGQTLQATALVHEAWLRLEKSAPQRWNSAGHFFSAAAEAMRRILVEQARRKSRQRHGGQYRRVGAEHIDRAAPGADERLLMVHEVLDEFAREDPFRAEIVKLKFYVGLSNEEIGRLHHLSERSVRRHWTFAKVRLMELMTPQDPNG